MDAPEQPAPDWQTELRQKSNEELLRLLHDGVGHDANEDYDEEIRKIFLERKAEFSAQGPGSAPVAGPPPTKTRVPVILGIMALNLFLIGPLTFLLVNRVTYNFWSSGGGPGQGRILFILNITSILFFTAIILGLLNGALLFAARKFPGLRPYRTGFLISLILCGLLFALSGLPWLLLLLDQ